MSTTSIKLDTFHDPSWHAGKSSADRRCRAEAQAEASGIRQSDQQSRGDKATVEILCSKIPVGLCLLDPGLRYVWVNERLANMHRKPAADHIGRCFRTVVSPEFASASEPLLYDVLRTGVPVLDREISTAISPDNQDVCEWLVACARVESVDGAVIGLQVAVQDISERKRTERALAEANQRLREFACIAAHDLQEPLRTIVSYSELTRHKSQGRLTPECDAHLGRVVDAARRMSRLIADVLRYSQATAPGEDNVGIVHLNAVVDSTVGLLGSLIDETGADVVRSRMPAVTGDAVRLGQVFQNLICNAIKYRQPGIAPRIRIGSQARDGGWIISVEDNGQGFRQEFAKEVFEAFRRLHGHDIPGSGIGLAICKAVVEDHGGRIWAESAPGQGTTFYFTLPARRRAGPQLQKGAAATAG